MVKPSQFATAYSTLLMATFRRPYSQFGFNLGTISQYPTTEQSQIYKAITKTRTKTGVGNT